MFAYDEFGNLIMDEFGNKYYYKNGRYHRDDGPAVEWADGSKSWWQYGNLHRLDGPAIEHADGFQWYFENQKINCQSQEEFERWLRLMVFS